MESLGIQAKDQNYLKLLADSDGNKSGVIEFEEFVDMMTGTLR